MNIIIRTLIILVATFLLSAGRLFSQGLTDAIINSQIAYEGTSRSIAMGGATGAMGGDVTALCINPGGLGLYRSNEITFTTGFQHNLTSSRYYGDRYNDTKTRLSIPNFGYVLSMHTSNYQPVRYIQAAVGLTRTNDFNYRSHAKGLNPSSSLIDSYLQTINGIDELFRPGARPGDYFINNYAYDLYPAWETHLIDQMHDSTGAIFYDSPIPQGNVYQDNVVASTGRSEEWTFALSTNIMDKVFIGTSLGMSHIKRHSTRTYTETPGPGSHAGFTEWSHQEILEDNAWGVNVKFGMIYAPTSWLRLGAAVHSKTMYSFDETWYTTTNSSLLEGNRVRDYWYRSSTLANDFNLNSPATYVASAAFLFGKKGMITTDVEYRNYSKAKLFFDNDPYNDANSDIQYFLKPSFNFRVGTEWKVRQFYLRSGAAYYGSPYGLGDQSCSSKRLGFGIGYETEGGVYWDFAYELGESTTLYTPYQFYVDDENVVENVVQRQWRNKVTATLKFKL